MKKVIITVALFVLVLFASSGLNVVSTPLSAGDMAPAIRVSNNDGTFDIEGKKDGYVLVTFWSAADAQSRIDCNRYNAWFNDNSPQNIKHIGINFDAQNELFEEIVRLDSLDTKAHYNVKGPEADHIRTQYGLNKGFGSVLINPEGRVSTFNPAMAELTSLI